MAKQQTVSKKKNQRQTKTLKRKNCRSTKMSSSPISPTPVESHFLDYSRLLASIEEIHHTTQQQAVQAINLALTLRNWFAGYYIVEYEQNGKDRANYGERLLKTLSQDLKQKLGRGFGERNLEMFRRFYMTYPISQSLIAKLGIALPIVSNTLEQKFEWQDEKYFTRLFRELSWTHFIELIHLEDAAKRAFYEVESLRNRWSVRELKRQKDSLLYERIGLSKDKNGVLALAKHGEVVSTPAEMVRNPCVFEFLGLKMEQIYHESQLEKAILDHLQEFLLELGKGFCFIARQRRITIRNNHYYIDLLLYPVSQRAWE